MDGRPPLRYLLTTTLSLAGGCEQQPGVEALPDGERDRFFLEAIRDGGFICAAVMTTQRITDDGRSWRVSCTDPAAYVVTVDGRSVTEVSPSPYAEPLPRVLSPTFPVPRTRPD